MTTIAFRDGVLAADTLVVTRGHVRAGYTRKVHRLHDGRLASFAGSYADCAQFIRWLRDSTQKEPDWDDLMGIVVTRDGEVDLYDHCAHPHRYDAPWHTIGSGAGIASGAMAHGATAIEAVEAAIQLDVFTGGEVHWARFGEQICEMRPRLLTPP